MGCRRQVKDPAPVVVHHHKSVEQLERDRRNHEQVHGGDAVCVTAKKCFPSRGGRSSPPAHVLGNGCLSDIDPEFEQLTMDSWCTPQRVCEAYLPDEVPDFQRHLRPPCPRPGLPAPEPTKSTPVPADHRLGFNDRQRLQYTRRQSIQPNKEEPVSVADDQPFGSLPTQHIELMAKSDNFRLAVNPRPEKSSDGAPDQTQYAYHHRQASTNILSLASQT